MILNLIIDIKVVFTSQQSIGLLVSGSIALEFFNREAYDGDLDAFCNVLYCKVAGEWLMSHGYLYQRKEGQAVEFIDSFSETPITSTTIDADTEEYRFSTVTAVWDFVKNSSKIQLIATCGAPLECIFSFHSSSLTILFVMTLYTY